MSYHILSGRGKGVISTNIMKDKNPTSGINGFTPLHIAAGNGNFEICKIIINGLCNKHLSPEDGIEICDDHDRTPLHDAAENGHLNIVQLLMPLMEDKNPMAFEEGGKTPMQLAAENGHEEIFHFIKDNIKDKNSKRQRTF